MTDIVKTKNQMSLNLENLDPYAAFGIASQTAPFLKFVKGVFKFGADDETLEIGTLLVPNMDELKSGFLKWDDGEPVGELMGLVGERKIPTRSDCGDLDHALWPTDQNGDRKDPWQVVNTLPMKDINTSEQYVYTTGSHGGISAIGKLATQYSRQRIHHRDQLPVIKIGTSSYRHKAYGDVAVPTFIIVKWVSEAELISGGTDGGGADLKDDLDDEIPM